MFAVYTETPNLCRETDDLEEAKEIAELYSAQGHQVEIRDIETGETLELFGCDDD